MRRILANANRPGYSGVINTLKPLALIASGQLTVGDDLTLDLLLKNLSLPRSESYEIKMAWRHLRLLNDHDCITHEAEQLACALENQQQPLWEMVVRRSYSEVFDALEAPLPVTTRSLKDAFHCCHYEPTKMRSRMFTLLKGLSKKAGLIVEEPKDVKMPDDLKIGSPLTVLQEPFAQKEREEGEISRRVTSFPILSLHASSHQEGDEKAKEMLLDKVLISLFQLLEDPLWTDANFSWWDQVVVLLLEQLIETIRTKMPATLLRPSDTLI